MLLQPGAERLRARAGAEVDHPPALDQELGDNDRAFLRLIEVLPKLDPSKRPKAVEVLGHNIVATLATCPDLDTTTLHSAIELVRRGRAKRGRSYGHRVCTYTDAKARWVLALLYWRIPKRRPRAIKLMEGAREDFLSLGADLAVAGISLSLGEMYVHKKQWRELETIAAETVRILERLPGASEAVIAYRQWSQAIAAQEAERLVELAEQCRDHLVRIRTE